MTVGLLTWTGRLKVRVRRGVKVSVSQGWIADSGVDGRLKVSEFAGA